MDYSTLMTLVSGESAPLIGLSTWKVLIPADASIGDDTALPLAGNFFLLQ